MNDSWNYPVYLPGQVLAPGNVWVGLREDDGSLAHGPHERLEDLLDGIDLDDAILPVQMSREEAARKEAELEPWPSPEGEVAQPELRYLVGTTADEINTHTWVIDGNPRFCSDELSRRRLAKRHAAMFDTEPIAVDFHWSSCKGEQP